MQGQLRDGDLGLWLGEMSLRGNNLKETSEEINLIPCEHLMPLVSKTHVITDAWTHARTWGIVQLPLTMENNAVKSVLQFIRY